MRSAPDQSPEFQPDFPPRLQTLGHESTGHSATGPAPTGPQATHPPASQDGPSFGPTAETVSLRKLLPHAKFFQCDDITVSRLVLNIAEAGPGDLVVFRTGVDDPVAIAAQALARGVTGILTEQLLPCPLPQAVVDETVDAECLIADRIEGHPSDSLLTIAVIGDAGKTSTALMIAGLLKRIGIRTAYETDLGDSDGIVQNVAATHATRSDLIAKIAAARDASCGAIVVELPEGAANHGHGVRWDLVVITGAEAGPTTSMERPDFGPDPLAFVLERAKRDAVVIAPADHPKLSRRIAQSGLRQVTYGTRRPAELSAKVFDEQPGETTLMVSFGDETAMMRTQHCGEANALNALAAIAVGLLLETPLTDAVEAVAKTPTIPGRMQRLPGRDSAAVVIDAGGSPERVAGTLRTLRRQRTNGGKLWCIFTLGKCGAQPNSVVLDSDRFARSGRYLERFADRIVLTSSDDAKPTFLASAHAVLDGFKEVALARLVADPGRAIDWAIRHAAPHDTILIITAVSSRVPSDRRQSTQELVRRIDLARSTTPHTHDNGPQILKMTRKA